jgi:hypothetical protein
MADVTKEIQVQAAAAVALQKEVEEKIASLKEAQEKINSTWKEVETVMIENDIKSIKGDFGSLTIAERTNYKADLDVLPAKFIKKVADTTKIATYAKLEDKLPKGVTISTTKYLTKRIK